MIQSRDGQCKIDLTMWEPIATEPKGVIQIVHGMTEHKGRYEDFAEYFTNLGFVVVGNDLISHGKSTYKGVDEKTLFVNSWNDLIADVLNVGAMMQHDYPELPIFLIGFSLGSYIVRTLPDLDLYQ